MKKKKMAGKFAGGCHGTGNDADNGICGRRYSRSI